MNGIIWTLTTMQKCVVSYFSALLSSFKVKMYNGKEKSQTWWCWKLKVFKRCLPGQCCHYCENYMRNIMVDLTFGVVGENFFDSFCSFYL